MSSPSTKLLSLKEAQARTQAQLISPVSPDSRYIDVGEGPAALHGKFHTVIDFPSERSVCFLLVLVLWYFHNLEKMQMWSSYQLLLLVNVGRKAQPRWRSLPWETCFPFLIWESPLLLPSPNFTVPTVNPMRWKPLPFQVQLWLSFSYQPVFVTNPSELPNLEGI